MGINLFHQNKVNQCLLNQWEETGHLWAFGSKALQFERMKLVCVDQFRETC